MFHNETVRCLSHLGTACSAHGVPCDSDHLRHRDRSLDSAGHTFSADAPLPVADLHDAVVAANRGNRRKDTVFGDAVEERLVAAH